MIKWNKKEMERNMAGSLLIAKYNNEIISVNDYQESVHTYLICPFCEDRGKELRVTYNKRGFFMAWRDKGLHICGRSALNFLEKDWIGTELVDVITNNDGDKEIIIDIFDGFNRVVKKVTRPSSEENDEKLIREYKQYSKKKKIFRDVIRTVKQLKLIIEKNEFPTLKKLNFKYRVGYDEILTIDELLILSSNIENRMIGKSRFILFKAHKASPLKKGNTRRYLNAYNAKGIDLSIAYDVVKNENPFSKLNGEFVLVYGRITKDKRSDHKFYVNLANDFHIEKVDEDFGKTIFGDTEFTEFDLEKYLENRKKEESKYNNKVEKLSVEEKRNTVIEPPMNTKQPIALIEPKGGASNNSIDNNDKNLALSSSLNPNNNVKKSNPIKKFIKKLFRLK